MTVTRLFIYFPTVGPVGGSRDERCERVFYRVVHKFLTLSARGNGYSHFTEPDFVA